MFSVCPSPDNFYILVLVPQYFNAEDLAREHIITELRDAMVSELQHVMALELRDAMVSEFWDTVVLEFQDVMVSELWDAMVLEMLGGRFKLKRS